MTGLLKHNNTVVLIPARGGSKGIPQKNLQPVGGVPLIVRSVQAARATGQDWPVFVSTDDVEIAELASSAGADVIGRPAHISADDSSSEDAVLHFLETTSRVDGALIMIQPTAPFLRGSDVLQLAEIRHSFDSGLTVCESHAFVWRAEPDSTLKGVNHDPAVRKRRQDLTTHEYFENGAAYYMDIAGFLKQRHRFFGRIGFITMPRLRSIEIDGPEDLVLANQIANVLED